MKFLIICASLLLQSQASKSEPIPIHFKQSKEEVVEFIPRAGALAMNVSYLGVPQVREVIAQALGLKLVFFNAWNPAGEAHVTVITPPEAEILLAGKGRYMSLKRINEIALENKIQRSDLNIRGLGSAQIKINNKPESTFFIIAESENLLKIRRLIFQEFIKNGGDDKVWDPQTFYPHITIGYTARDLHLSDGVIKDVQHSLDNRFDLIVTH